MGPQHWKLWRFLQYSHVFGALRGEAAAGVWGGIVTWRI